MPSPCSCSITSPGVPPGPSGSYPCRDRIGIDERIDALLRRTDLHAVLDLRRESPMRTMSPTAVLDVRPVVIAALESLETHGIQSTQAWRARSPCLSPLSVTSSPMSFGVPEARYPVMFAARRAADRRQDSAAARILLVRMGVEGRVFRVVDARIDRIVLFPLVGNDPGLQAVGRIRDRRLRRGRRADALAGETDERSRRTPAAGCRAPRRGRRPRARSRAAVGTGRERDVGRDVHRGRLAPDAGSLGDAVKRAALRRRRCRFVVRRRRRLARPRRPSPPASAAFCACARLTQKTPQSTAKTLNAHEGEQADRDLHQHGAAFVRRCVRIGHLRWSIDRRVLAVLARAGASTGPAAAGSPGRDAVRRPAGTARCWVGSGGTSSGLSGRTRRGVISTSSSVRSARSALLLNRLPMIGRLPRIGICCVVVLRHVVQQAGDRERLAVAQLDVGLGAARDQRRESGSPDSVMPFAKSSELTSGRTFSRIMSPAIVGLKFSRMPNSLNMHGDRAGDSLNDRNRESRRRPGSWLPARCRRSDSARRGSGDSPCVCSALTTAPMSVLVVEEEQVQEVAERDFQAVRRPRPRPPCAKSSKRGAANCCVVLRPIAVAGSRVASGEERDAQLRQRPAVHFREPNLQHAPAGSSDPPGSCSMLMTFSLRRAGLRDFTDAQHHRRCSTRCPTGRSLRR